MTIERQTRNTESTANCPDCGAVALNVQGLRVCERCSWTATS